MNGKKGNKIGLLGGTFNPVHMGHLILAQSALETFDLNRVLFIPCSTPPHKGCGNLLSAQHRTEMLEAAVEGDPRFEVSPVEIDRGGVSYAIDTVRELQQQHVDDEIFFIIGSDTLPELHSWRSIQELLELCTFITFGRPGFDREAIRQRGLQLGSPWEERLLENLFFLRQIDISSSDIRHRIAEGLSIRYLVPPEVEMFIAEHGLY